MMHGRLNFKHGADRLIWPKADPRLAKIVELAQRWLIDEAQIYHMTVTSFYRPQPQSSTHAHHRAADIRTRDMPEGVAERLADWLNWMFKYGVDHSRRDKHVAIFGRKMDASGLHDDHIHLQVPPRSDHVALR